jgi:pilus assembly protein CpaB
MSGNKAALILSLVCALIASFLVYRALTQNAAPKVVKIPKVEVVCAKIAIPARSEISAAQVELRPIPQESVTSNMIRTLKDVTGKVTKSEIVRGEPVLAERLLKKGQKYSLSFLIPQGMRAITVAIDEVSGVAGFIRPGERVDVIGTVELGDAHLQTSWTVIQDAEVLAVAQDMGEPFNQEKADKKGNSSKNSAKRESSATLAVTPVQAQQLALAEQKGVLRLTLRPLLREDSLKIGPLPETALLPKPPAAPGKSRSFRKPTPVVNTGTRGRKVEVISGGKSTFITVY